MSSWCCRSLQAAHLHSSPQPSAAAPAAAIKLEDSSLPLPRFVARGEKHRPPPCTLPNALHFVKVGTGLLAGQS